VSAYGHNGVALNQALDPSMPLIGFKNVYSNGLDKELVLVRNDTHDRAAVQECG
jgi:hypothetical protein